MICVQFLHFSSAKDKQLYACLEKVSQLEAQCIREAVERARDQAKFKDFVNQNTQHRQEIATLRESLEAESKRARDLQSDKEAAREEISRLDRRLVVIEAQNVMLESNIELLKQEGDVRVANLENESETRLRNLRDEFRLRLNNRDEEAGRRLADMTEENQILRDRIRLLNALNAHEIDRLLR